MRLFTDIELDPEIVPYEGATIFVDNHMPKFLDSLLEKFGNSPISHCAIMLRDSNGEPMVYEAVPMRVRKMPWAQYITDVLEHWANYPWTEKNGGIEAFYWEPNKNLPDEMLDLMKAKAEKHLGERYRLFLNYLSRRGTRGWHCSQYAGAVWDETGLIDYINNKETPSSLYMKLLETGLGK